MVPTNRITNNNHKTKREMKRYHNAATGEWHTQGAAVTRRTDGGLFSGVPTDEMLKAWGFEEYTEPQPEPLTEEQIAERERERRMAEIQAELASMDYLTSKHIDGEDMSAYGDWQERRRALRAEFNELENSVRETD